MPAEPATSWLDGVLSDAASLPGRRIQALWDGYGEIRRIELPGEPGSVILKRVTPPAIAPGRSDEAALRSHRRKLRSYEVERSFYANYAARCGPGCRVARAYGLVALERGFCFVLEDLDRAGFSHKPRIASEQELHACWHWLAEFHATFLEAPTGQLWPQGSYWHLETRPDELRALTREELRRAAPLLDRALRGARHRTLIHGDAKLENFCFDATGRAAAVDFQYVGGGVGVQDVAYLLNGCLPWHGAERHAQHHLDVYFAALVGALRRLRPDCDASAVEREWRALYAIAWADFCRFLLGWAKERQELDPYSERLVVEAVRTMAADGAYSEQ